MPARLVARVQADRLPSVTDPKSGKVFDHVGLRVAALVDIDPGESLPRPLAGIAKDFRPWEWLSWNPHQRSSWRVFRLDFDGMAWTSLELGAEVSEVVLAPGEIDLGPYQVALGERLDEIAAQDGEAAVCLPAADEPVEHRTVFGMVESLTDLPHPIPAGLRVFTVLAIEGDLGDARIIAVPKLALPTGGDFDIAGMLIPDAAIQDPDGEIRVTAQPVMANPPWPSELVFRLQATPALADMTRSRGSARLLDLMTLTIAGDAPDSAVGDEDYAAQLPGRLAEALDPAARIVSAFDRALESLRGSDDFKAIQEDIANAGKRQSYLVQTLDRMTIGSFLPVARGSEAVASVAVTLFAALARERGASGARSEAARNAGQMLLRMLDRDDDLAATTPSREIYALMSVKRMAAAVGLAPETVVADGEAAPADAEEGFSRFIRHMWFETLTTGERPISAGRSRLLAAKVVTATTVDMPTVRPEAVLDADILIEPGLTFTLVMTAEGATAELRIGAAKPVLKLTRKPSGIIEASLDAASASFGLAAADRLVFRLALSADRSMLNVIFVDKGVSLQTPAFDVARRSFQITLSASGAHIEDFQPGAPDSVFTAQFSARLTTQTARGTLALAFAGPYMKGLLEGRTDWGGTSAPPPSSSPAEAVGAAMRALGLALYTKLYEGGGVGVLPPPWLSAFISKIIALAAEDAARLAVAAIPMATLGRLTMDAPPLVVRIDQFQSFAADSWARVAGYGALLARVKPATTPTEWWTLNAAALYAMPKDKPHDPKQGIYAGIVDPVAIQIGEGGGVRQSLLSYNNRWLATGLESDTGVDEAGAPDGVMRRPELLAPPPWNQGYVLPALSFGYDYAVLPYLIGHGGVLPLWLRKAPDQPLERLGERGKKIADPLTQPALLARHKLYLRSRAIGGPRLVESKGEPALPGARDDIAPLAAELPIRPPPITLAPGATAMFFRDISGQRGVLSWEIPVADEVAGYRFLLGSVCKPGSDYGGSPSPVGKLHIALWGVTEASSSPSRLWRSDPLVDIVGDFRISLLVENHAASPLTIHVERQKTRTDYFEDEVIFETERFYQISGLDPLGWRDLFLAVEVPGDGTAAQLEPAVAIAIRRPTGSASGTPSLVAGKPLIAPETSHRSRTISLFDGIGGTLPKRSAVWRRPGVDFGNFERWINPALIETSGGPEAEKQNVRTAINEAYVIATREPDNQDREVSFEDPAVVALCVELVEIFPKLKNIGIKISKSITGSEVFISASVGTEGTARFPTMTFTYGEAALAVTAGTAFAVTLKKGRIYELRCYPVLASGRQSFSPFDTLARLSPEVLATLRQVSVDGTAYMLASPNVTTLEIATDELLAFYDSDGRPTSGWAVDKTLIVVDRPPASRDDVAHIYLPAPLFAQANFYPAARYADKVSLYAQRWSWRGRPQAEIESPQAAMLLPNSAWAKSTATTAFLDRRDDDVGDIIMRRLERAHIYAGREQVGEKPPGRDKQTALFVKSLDWRAGLNLWRFGLSVTSRYAPLFAPRVPSEVLAHLPPPGGVRTTAAWSALAIPDRPSGRVVGRPGLALVLPLTEPLMAAGATPPLLAVFNDRLYSNFNIADAIDVAVEVARHPYTIGEQIKRRDLVREWIQKKDPRGKPDELFELERALSDHRPAATDSLKYWQEFGPDPIRTGQAHDGAPILLRVDGPIGYTFDAETEAGRFDHAGLLISPVAQDVDPWSMIKLRFRRVEALAALAAEPEPLTPGAVKTIALTGRSRLGDATDYDGLVIEVAEIAKGQSAVIGFDLVDDGIGLPVVEPPDVKVSLSRIDGVLTIAAATRLGEAGKSDLALRAHEQAQVRLIVSERERPEGVKEWTPRGDVAIKVMVMDKDSGVDALEQLDRNHWLAVNTVPLGGRKPVPSDLPLKLRITPEATVKPPKAGVHPVRLSTFTPAVWCQFTEAMSSFAATVAGAAGDDRRRIGITDLEADYVAGTPPGIRLRLKTAAEASAVSGPLRSLAPLAAADPDAQVDEVLAAVVTRYVTDAFARLRERPVAILHLTDDEYRPLRAEADFTLALKKENAAWWPDDPPLAKGGGGRVRLLRMLVPRTRSMGGFAAEPTRQLAEFFRKGDLNLTDLNPGDAAGMVLGISHPIEWK